MDPWESDAPFTKEQEDGYNRYTHFPANINKEFGNQVRGKEDAVKEKLADYGITELSEDLKKALWYYRKAVYEYYLEESRARNMAPPVYVVGPSNYNYSKLPRADKVRGKAHEKITVSEKYIEGGINRLISGRPSLATLDEYLPMVAESKNRVDMGKKYAEWEKEKLRIKQKMGANLTNMDLMTISGDWDHVSRQRGRMMYDRLLPYVKKPESAVLESNIAEIPQETMEKPLIPGKSLQVDLGGETTLIPQKYTPPKQADTRQPRQVKSKPLPPGQKDLSGGFQSTLFAIGAFVFAAGLTRLVRRKS